VTTQTTGKLRELLAQFGVEDVTLLLAIDPGKLFKIFAPVFRNVMRIMHPGLVQCLEIRPIAAIKQRCLLQCLHPLLAHDPMAPARQKMTVKWEIAVPGCLYSKNYR
jgi:hypothetical protein